MVGIMEEEQVLQQQQLESEEEEEGYEQLEKMSSPVAASWIENGLVKGVVMIDDDALLLFDSKYNSSSSSSSLSSSSSSMVVDNINNNNKKRKMKMKDNNYKYTTCCQVYDVCPICFEPWTSSYENHQLCSLPCGHIYGRSCIIKSLQLEDQNSAARCPQCNTLCTLEDVRPLYGTRLSIAKNKKASPSPTTATRHFEYTKDGYKALKKFVLQRKSITFRLETFSSNRHADMLRRAKDTKDRLSALSKQRGELLKSPAGTEADAFERQVLSLALRCDALEHRAYALGKQVCTFRRLNAAYSACIDYFEDVCKARKLDAVLVES